MKAYKEEGRWEGRKEDITGREEERKRKVGITGRKEGIEGRKVGTLNGAGKRVPYPSGKMEGRKEVKERR